MLQAVFDTITRHGATSAPRGSRLERTPSVTASGKGGQKGKKLAKKRCQKQVGECQSAITEICAGDPDCLAALPCCEFFGRCDTTGALACIAVGGALPPSRC